MSLQDRIESLKSKHQSLETAIEAERRRPLPDTAALSVLKRRKLLVKEEIDRLTRH